MKDETGVKIADASMFDGIDINSIYCGGLWEGGVILGWSGDDADSGIYSMNRDGSQIKHKRLKLR